MKIIYWSDYACPYCYIGEERIKKVLSELDMPYELEMKAFQLDPSAGRHAATDTVTRFAKKYRLSLENAAAQIDYISQLGIAEGIDFKYSSTLFTNTMDAHRLTKLAQSISSEIANKISERLYAAYFTDNLELADKNVLIRIGVDNGLSKTEIENMLESDKYKKEVLLDEQEAASYGIHAVPYFIINDKYEISGAQSKNAIKSALIKIQSEETAEKSIEGAHCGPNGCSF
ncbi:MAG: DsbA family oxidoreductase [Firmicutes bacterium]|nr:DsbA family oxidoreductase [Bacillota bacterium]